MTRITKADQARALTAEEREANIAILKAASEKSRRYAAMHDPDSSAWDDLESLAKAYDEVITAIRSRATATQDKDATP